VAHVLRFYRLYHSSRYVGEQLVLRFHHTRRQFGLLRALIHRINGFAGPDAPASAKVGEAGDTSVA
jgi:hypothetical protein